MSKTIKMTENKFYLFTQNNSGGDFDVDENVCHHVIIEANDESYAKQLFEPMIEDQSGSCECCGPRWGCTDPDEVVMFSESLHEYAQKLANMSFVFSSPEVIIHHLDGNKTKIYHHKDSTNAKR